MRLRGLKGLNMVEEAILAQHLIAQQEVESYRDLLLALCGAEKNDLSIKVYKRMKALMFPETVISEDEERKEALAFIKHSQKLFDNFRIVGVGRGDTTISE